MRRLRYALEGGQGAAVLFGPPGSGKTLVARRLASGRSAPEVHITFPMVSAPELIGQLAEELGVPPLSRDTLNGTLHALRTHLAALVSRGARPLVIVDEAHMIDDRAAFEALRLLLNFATDGPPDLFLLLVGGAEVLLDLPRGLADRIAARCLVAPFTESEFELPTSSADWRPQAPRRPSSHQKPSLPSIVTATDWPAALTVSLT